MMRIAYLITRSRAVAEEITQDCFLAVFRRWGTLTSGWLPPPNGGASGDRHPPDIDAEHGGLPWIREPQRYWP